MGWLTLLWADEGMGGAAIAPGELGAAGATGAVGAAGAVGVLAGGVTIEG